MEVLAAGPEAARRAADVVRAGGVVALPTDTLYGLAADPGCAAAVARLHRMKGRPPAKPYPVLVPSLEAALRLCADFPDCARRLAEAFWPGPLTLLLPARPGLPPGYTAGTGVIGLRIARHPTVAHTLATLPGGVTGTSANRAAGPPARSASEVRAAFAGADAGADDAPDLILDGGSSHAPAPSSVVDCRSPPAVRVVREGAIPASDIVEVAAGR